MKILNLYAGIGGNRKLWQGHKITAVEYKQEIADVYSDLFPNDDVVVCDAHEFLLEEFEKYDFIWSSPPCPTHSHTNNFLHAQGVIRYPDMKLYEEIVFLQKWFKGKYVVENVKSYYKPLIAPYEIDRHYFWSNFVITPTTTKDTNISVTNCKGKTRRKWAEHIKSLEDYHGFDLSGFKQIGKHGHYKLLANCVHPPLGKHVLDCALGLNKQKILL